MGLPSFDRMVPSQESPTSADFSREARDSALLKPCLPPPFPLARAPATSRAPPSSIAPATRRPLARLLLDSRLRSPMVVEHPRYFSIYSSGKPAPGDDTSDAREGSPALPLPPSPASPPRPRRDPRAFPRPPRRLGPDGERRRVPGPRLRLRRGSPTHAPFLLPARRGLPGVRPRRRRRRQRPRRPQDHHGRRAHPVRHRRRGDPRRLLHPTPHHPRGVFPRLRFSPPR